MRVFIFVASVVLGLTLCSPRAHAQCQGWLASYGVPGVNGLVYASTLWDPDADGPLPELLIVGGRFSLAGATPASNIASWDGSRWAPLGAGLTRTDGNNADVLALTVHQGRLIAGGSFLMAGGASIRYVAEWDGATWRALGSQQFNQQVGELYSSGDSLYAGGWFTAVGAVQARAIARWDGHEWSAMGPGLTGGFVPRVMSITEYNGRIVAGGVFTASGSTPLAHIAEWDGNAWQSIGTGINSTGFIRKLHVRDNLLIAGGDFSTAGGAPAFDLAAWDGASWSPFAGGSPTADLGVFDILEWGDDLVIAGELSAVGGPLGDPNRIAVRNIAAWNGKTWRPLGAGLHHRLETLAKFRGRVIVGGSINQNDDDAYGVTSWDGSQWRSLNEGFSIYGRIEGMGPDADSILAYRNMLTRHEIVRWDGARWSTYATFDREIAAWVRHNADLYVAGRDTSCSIARFDGAAWHPVPLQLASIPQSIAHVYAMDIYQGDVVAAVIYGDFGSSFNWRAILRWNGTSWTQMGETVNNYVFNVRTINGDLYCTGTFTTIGAQQCNRIARWDGQNWMPLATGLNGNTGALAGYNGDLIVAGDFTRAGGNDARAVARWDGAAWHPLGTWPPASASVSDLVVHNGLLYACGAFTSPGGTPALNIARWNGAQWSALGAGLAHPGAAQAGGYDLGVLNDEVLVSGDFSLAGGLTTGTFARWTTTGVPHLTQETDAIEADAGSTIIINATVAPGYEARGPVNIQWRRNGNVVSDGAGGASPGGALVSGATTPALTLTGVRCSDAGEYICAVATSCGEAATAGTTLTVSACCPGDFNADGAVTSSDFFDFLAFFFQEDPRADFNHDAAIDSRDFFDFLAAFFTPC